MFILNFLRYLRGYVVFHAKGMFVERFLNLAARDGIAIWNSLRRGELFAGSAYAGDYRRLRHHARKTGVRMRVAEKHGVPFKRHKYRKRTGLLLGLGVFFIFVFAVSRFVWRVEVSGNESLTESEIVIALEEIGVKPGVLRSSVDVRGVERRIILAFDRLVWAALNINGSTAYIEVRENSLKPGEITEMGPCNIVASHSGQIISMTVTEGHPLKFIGDAVLKGEVIVSGVTQTRLGHNTLRHARAKVVARVEHEITVTAPYEQTIFQDTGQIATRTYFRLFGWELPLFPPFEIPRPYHAEREFAPFKLFGRELYSGIFTERFHLMEETEIAYSMAEARSLAIKELELREKAEFLDAEILDKTVVGRPGSTGFTLEARYDCMMNVAAEKPIRVESAQGRNATAPAAQ